MKKILFVCSGNTCRSPMAEIILKKKIKLAGIKGIKVSSAGLQARDGDVMSDNARIALKKLGYRAYAFKSKLADAKILLESDAIICMTERHKTYIKQFPNVYSVNDITGQGDVFDPFGGDITEYVGASHQIEDCCNIIIKKIINKMESDKK